jgi:adenylosuccinate synthase
MPTELDDGPEGFGEILRRRGREFGTVTGRPRRCGWFDGVAAAYAQRINRFDVVCVMLLDVLDTMDEIPICTGYTLDGRSVRSFPPVVSDAMRLTPVFERLAGWKADTTGITRWDDLPEAARAYLARLGEVIGAPVAMVSVGPDRAQSILRPGSAFASHLQSI